jgi:hypothetical protein
MQGNGFKGVREDLVACVAAGSRGGTEKRHFHGVAVETVYLDHVHIRAPLAADVGKRCRFGQRRVRGVPAGCQL